MLFELYLDISFERLQQTYQVGVLEMISYAELYNIL
jgi:hypothetical protein